ncbi:MAG: peroxidase-related enzyme [candidate division KSB1 bacterium]|nr:peroxidase-related enzyme [candidate division KSB1 bacterium]MDZ7365083.1 peroxidase-related enzyme [candidate division KSB1 bacterium]MDZ7407249.1 peroxidase-related enzyme [candidate division KSB1 bacterium]
MPWVKVISESAATGDLLELYKEQRKKGKHSDVPLGEASMPPAYSVFSQNGAALCALKELEAIIRFGKSELSRLQREMIATVTSRLNECVFCTMAHARFVRDKTKDEKFYEDLVRDYQQADLRPADRAMLDYAAKLTQNPGAVTAEDVAGLRAHGFSDAAITDIALNVSFMCLYNRMILGLGAEVQPHKLEEARRLGMKLPPHEQK